MLTAGTWLFQRGIGNPKASCQLFRYYAHYFALALFLFSALSALVVNISIMYDNVLTFLCTNS